MPYGWYSAEADKQHGHAVWSSPEGPKRVTLMTRTPDKGIYLWKDTVFLGEILELVRVVNRGKNIYIFSETGVTKW